MRAAQHADPTSAELTAVANAPQAYWIVPESSAAAVAKFTSDAQAAGATPVLTLYGISHRDCGSWIDGIAHADAYLWIKRPGESDGTCGKGDPPAGTFVNQYAMELARNAQQ